MILYQSEKKLNHMNRVFLLGIANLYLQHGMAEDKGNFKTVTFEEFRPSLQKRSKRKTLPFSASVQHKKCRYDATV